MSLNLKSQWPPQPWPKPSKGTSICGEPVFDDRRDSGWIPVLEQRTRILAHRQNRLARLCILMGVVIVLMSMTMAVLLLRTA